MRRDRPTYHRIVLGKVGFGWLMIGCCLAGSADRAGLRAATSLPSRCSGQLALPSRPRPRARASLQTEHFVVSYDTTRAVAEALACQAEATHEAIMRFCAALGIDHRRAGDRLKLVLFERREDYAQCAASVGFDARATRGFYHEATNRSVFFNAANDPAVLELKRRLAQARRRPEVSAEAIRRLSRRLASIIESVNRTVIRHEVAHQVLHNCGLVDPDVQAPTWLVEGLACLFEIPPRSAEEVVALNRDRLATFMRAVQARQVIPLRRFLATRHLPAASGAAAERFYAQCWALTYYLLHDRPERFATYVGRFARQDDRCDGPDAWANFQSVFGPADERFVERWIEFTRELARPETARRCD